MARDRHLAAIEGAIGRIHRGSFYQVNLCTRLHAETSSPAPMIFAALAERLQPTYGGLVSRPPATDGTPRAVASFSPELFLSVHDGTIKTAPIKGTAPRVSGAVDSPELRASTKDAAENVMIVDLMRNDLSRVCRPGTVQVDELLSVQPAPGVWHLVSTVSGQLQPGMSTAEVLTATFPPGSVTGAPKIAAQQGIQELEDARSRRLHRRARPGQPVRRHGAERDHPDLRDRRPRRAARSRRRHHGGQRADQGVVRMPAQGRSPGGGGRLAS